jgi:sarcosine reductase
MRLDLHKHRIEGIQFGKATEIEGHTLIIHKEELIRVLSGGPSRIADVIICRPGEKVRITNVLDIVEPRVKAKGGGEVFPGFWGASEKVGSGVTKVLEGVAVMEVASIPRVQEGLVDMEGVGATYSPFSQTNNMVLVFEPPAGIALSDFEKEVRIAGLMAGTYLAKAALNREPDESEIFEWDLEKAGPEQGRGLKRIGYIYMLQSQGFLRDTFLYGRCVGSLTATQIHPNEIMDGAIVSGNYVIPSNRNPTYFHLNNPIIRELHMRNGHDLLFGGLVVCNEHSRLEDKERAAQEVVETLRECDVEGVIVTKEGGGNADTDLMFMCSACESQGIRTVLLGNEGAGPDGRDPSLAHISPDANAFVTTGNNDESVALGAVDKLIGRGPLPGVNEDLKGELSVPVSRIHGAANLLGYGMLTCTLT